MTELKETQRENSSLKIRSLKPDICSQLSEQRNNWPRKLTKDFKWALLKSFLLKSKEKNSKKFNNLLSINYGVLTISKMSTLPDRDLLTRMQPPHTSTQSITMLS